MDSNASPRNEPSLLLPQCHPSPLKQNLQRSTLPLAISPILATNDHQFHPPLSKQSMIPSIKEFSKPTRVSRIPQKARSSLPGSVILWTLKLKLAMKKRWKRSRFYLVIINKVIRSSTIFRTTMEELDLEEYTEEQMKYIKIPAYPKEDQPDS